MNTVHGVNSAAALRCRPAQPVECPECHRMFKNNKALNGHMRLHGGFDWTKRVSGDTHTHTYVHVCMHHHSFLSKPVTLVYDTCSFCLLEVNI